MVASVHSKLKMDAAAMTRRMVAPSATRRPTCWATAPAGWSPGGRGTRPQSTFDAEAVFTACAEHDVAVEINSRPERWDPPDELVELALDARLPVLDRQRRARPRPARLPAYGAERAQRLGVPLERIVTTWPVDRLLAWANG